MEKITLKFEKFQKALSTLESIYLKPVLEDRSTIDATIQRFEFTFELFWKFLKDFFEERDLKLNYPKEIIKEAYQVGLIHNETLWLQMLVDRNMTPHTYDEELANEIFIRIKQYVPLLRDFCEKIKSE